MRARLPVRVMLTASLTFLASLYLTWVSATPATSSGSGSGVASLLNLMSVGGFGQSDGWGLLGQAAAIGAVALGLCALVSLIRPELEAALPIGDCAIALAALALSDAADLRTQGMYHAGLNGLSVHRGVGAYLGGAAALVALLSAAWLSHDDIPEPRIAAAATLLTMGLIAAYVLPTFSVHVHRLNGSLGYQYISVGSYGTAIMLLIASFGLTFWFGSSPPERRIAAGAVVLVLAVGGFSPLGTHVHWPYEAWLAIGCAAGLPMLALATTDLSRLGWPSRLDALALEGAALLLISLFFNWQKSCPAPPDGSCFVSNGWGGGLTGGLAALLVLAYFGLQRVVPELAIAIGIYVAAVGLSLTADVSLAYGAYLGFAGAALLLLAVAPQLRSLATSSTGKAGHSSDSPALSPYAD